MTVLHLGVVDVNYSYPDTGKPGKKPKTAANITTGDVAEILEAKYHPMETFFELHAQEIADELAGSVAGALESLAMGAPTNLSPIGTATSAIEEKFKAFLSNKEMEGLGIPGIPTKAALEGVSHRFKHPYAKRAPRPSLIDTGQYQAAFKAWIE